MSEREFDITVWGASGFTGRFIVEELMTIYPEYTIAVAGRNALRTLNNLKNHSAALKSLVEGNKLRCFECELGDAKRLGAMAASSRVVISAAGPFQLIGMPVVDACVANGAHYVDITGEPSFVELVHQKHHVAAAKAGLSIITCCGFDCIPSDLSIHQIRKELPNVKRIEGFVSSDAVGNNTGTLFTAVASLRMAGKGELKNLRSSSIRKPLPKLGFKPKSMFYEKRVPNHWCLVFAGADGTIVRNSQIERLPEQPIEVGLFFAFPSVLVAIAMVWVALVIFVVAKFPSLEFLLRKYPGFFTLGVFSDSASPEALAKKKGRWDFIITLHDASIRKAEITMPDPGYAATSRMVVAAAVQCLRCPDIARGAVTTATAFGDTDFLQMLKKRDIVFTLH